MPSLDPPETADLLGEPMALSIQSPPAIGSEQQVDENTPQPGKMLLYVQRETR
jgi:hypothetical protein